MNELLSLCEEFCKNIRLMGEVWCFRELSLREDEPDPEYIEQHWLEYTPQCLVDVYTKGIKVIEKYKHINSISDIEYK
jgi:hypothetical protein